MACDSISRTSRATSRGGLAGMAREYSAGAPNRLDRVGKEDHSLPMESTISSKGQVTVPAEVRERLGLRPGTRVAFELQNEGALLRRIVPPEHPVDRLFGILDLGKPVDQAITEMRGALSGRRRKRR